MRNFIQYWKAEMVYYLTWIEMKETGWRFRLEQLLLHGTWNKRPSRKKVDEMRRMLRKMRK